MRARKSTNKETGERTYTIDGVSYPSVTTITGLLSTKSLLKWYAEQAALTGDAREPERLAKKAADRGVAVHKLIETQLKTGLVDPSPGDSAEYVTQFSAFAKAFGPVELVKSEVKLCHVDERYAGTTDAVVRIPRHGLCILDFKTTTSSKWLFMAPKMEHRMQLEAYRRAWHRMFGEWIHGTGIVRLAPDRFAFDLFLNTEKDFDTNEIWKNFLRLRDVYNFVKAYPSNRGHIHK